MNTPVSFTDKTRAAAVLTEAAGAYLAAADNEELGHWTRVAEGQAAAALRGALEALQMAADFREKQW